MRYNLDVVFICKLKFRSHKPRLHISVDQQLQQLVYLFAKWVFLFKVNAQLQQVNQRYVFFALQALKFEYKLVNRDLPFLELFFLAQVTLAVCL